MASSAWIQRIAVTALIGLGGCLIDALPRRPPSDGGLPKPSDAGDSEDAGIEDGGPLADGGQIDAGPGDAAYHDAGVDAGVHDAGLADAGSLDAGMPDAGVLDAGVADAGPADAGSRDAGRICQMVDCGGYACNPNGGCKTACAVHEDCAPTYFCVSPACVPKRVNGEACAFAIQCASGYCVRAQNDFRCAAVRGCLACQVIDPTGVACVYAEQGTDPKNNCTANGVCQSDFCDGNGTCNAAAGTPCGATTCSGATRTTYACNASGTCVPTNHSCNGYVCESVASCRTTCVDDGHCTTDFYCAAGETCAPRKNIGEMCNPLTDCMAPPCRLCQGPACVDGFCCNMTCGETCYACSFAKTGAGNGSCSPVRDGQDYDNDCTLDATTCTGDTCNGAGACSPPAGRTQCADPSCTNSNGFGQYQSATLAERICDRITSGSCPLGLGVDCAGRLICESLTACKGACARDADCTAPNYCAGTACAERKNVGDPCNADGECRSRICTGEPAGQCRLCESNSDCWPAMVVCGSGGTICKACTNTTECALGGFGSTCYNGFCHCTVAGDGGGGCTNPRAPFCSPLGPSMTPCTCGMTGGPCPVGQSCTTNTQDGTCKWNHGQPCVQASDCLSNACVNGTCAALTGGG